MILDSPTETSVQLLPKCAVYAYMNGEIFKLFGAAILVLDAFLVVVFGLGMPRIGMSTRSFIEVELLFFTFLIVTAMIAIGMIRVQRWAAVATSTVGLVGSIILALSLGTRPWEAGLVGMPVVFGLLLPLYATVRYWSSLKVVNSMSLTPFVDAPGSSDRLHLG